jgi:hypothetical protein
LNSSIYKDKSIQIRRIVCNVSCENFWHWKVPKREK